MFRSIVTTSLFLPRNHSACSPPPKPMSSTLENLYYAINNSSACSPNIIVLLLVVKLTNDIGIDKIKAPKTPQGSSNSIGFFRKFNLSKWSCGN